MDRRLRLGTAHRGSARPAHSPRPYPGTERRKLPPETFQVTPTPQVSPRVAQLAVDRESVGPDTPAASAPDRRGGSTRRGAMPREPAPVHLHNRTNWPAFTPPPGPASS